MRKTAVASIVFGVAVIMVIVSFAGGQRQPVEASVVQTAAPTTQPPVAPTALPSNIVIAASSASVLGGAGTENWTPTYIAMQDFQKGWMFWISTTKMIW